MSRITFGVWAAMALIFVPLAGAQSYTVTDLGTLGGGNYAIPQGINDDGAVAGYATLSNGIQHAFVWTSTTGMRDIGTLGGAASQSNAEAINNSGEVVGFSYLPGEEGARAFIWTSKGGMHGLGTLGGKGSFAYGINDSGQVVGDSFLADGITLHPFLWTATEGMQDLGNLGGRESYAQGISQSGEVVGYSYLADNITYHAFRWTRAGGLEDLGSFDGTDSVALAINTSGEIAGLGFAPPNTYQQVAALWTASGRMQAMGTGPNSIALGLNESNQVVGYFGQYIPAAAMLWTPKSRAQNLNTLIPPNPRWLLTAAFGINTSGQIAAYGTINGETHAALLTPTK